MAIKPEELSEAQGHARNGQTRDIAVLMKCPDCGKATSLTAVACPNCGARISSGDVSQAVAVRNAAFKITTIAVWLALGVVWYETRNWFAGFIFWSGAAILVAGLLERRFLRSRSSPPTDESERLAYLRETSAIVGRRARIGWLTAVIIGLAMPTLFLYVRSAVDLSTRDDGVDAKPNREIASRTDDLSSLRVRGQEIHVGDTADAVFAILNPTDPVSQEADPNQDSTRGLVVTKVYRFDHRLYALTFAQESADGPYTLVRIEHRSDPTQNAYKGAKDTSPALSTANVIEGSPDPRQHYLVEVLAFDARTGYAGGQADYMRLRITNRSNVVLPTLTIRTNRWIRGEEAGWSRSPPIDVSDLQPGESIVTNYYPMGHLSAAALGGEVIDSMTVWIETRIPPDATQFFPEYAQVAAILREAEQRRMENDAAQIAQESERQVDAALFKQQLAASKEAAWRAYFRPDPQCDNPADWDVQVQCGNAHIKAKRAFEEKWAKDHGTSP